MAKHKKTAANAAAYNVVAPDFQANPHATTAWPTLRILIERADHQIRTQGLTEGDCLFMSQAEWGLLRAELERGRQPVYTNYLGQPVNTIKNLKLRIQE